jgi:hypothetical protein
VGGSDEFGKTQMVPVCDGALDAGLFRLDAVCPVRAADTLKMRTVRTSRMGATIVHCTSKLNFLIWRCG